MAGFYFNVPFTDVQLETAPGEMAVASIKAPTNQDVRITDLEIYFTGIDGAAEPIQVRLVRITVDSGTATAVTEVSKDNRLGGTIQSVCRHTFTADPTITANTDLWVGRIHAQGGNAKDYEFKNVWVARGTEVALCVKVLTGTAVKATGQLGAEE